MRKKLLALLLAAALALSLLAGCGGGESVASALLKLLDGRYPNISIEIDPELEADLRQAIRKAEAENAGDDAAVIRAALEKLVGSTVTFRKLGEGQQGDTTFDLVFYAGSDPGKAAQAAYSQWNPILSNVPDDGQYDTSLAMVETNSGVWMLVKATVEKAGTPDKPDRDDPEPVITDIDASKYNLDELNSFLTANPSITTVDFSNIKGSIPEGVLSGTKVSKVIVETGTTVMDGAFAGTKDPLTIEVTTGSGTVNSSILGGASGVTLDLSKSGLTTIESSAFEGCTGLTSVTFPESLTGIEEAAFLGCTGLASVTLPEGLTYIDVYAFLGCTGLTSVTFPEGLTDIDMGAFLGCTGLTSIVLSDCTSLESIKKDAFYGCTGLTSVTFPESLTTIEPHAFYGCTGLTSIDLNDCTGLERIGEEAFSGCTGLKSVDLSDCTGLERIGKEAFSGCDSLNQVTLPNRGGDFWIDMFAFAVDSGPQPQPQPLPLHLRIPNADITLYLGTNAFSNRAVTVYYNGSNEITSSIEDPGGGKVVDIKPYPSNP